jgi:hypothetical protein
VEAVDKQQKKAENSISQRDKDLNSFLLGPSPTKKDQATNIFETKKNDGSPIKSIIGKKRPDMELDDGKAGLSQH